MTFAEAKAALALKLDITYSDIANNDQFSDADLGELINAAARMAWNYKPWPFTKGAKSVATVDSEYFDYPGDFEDGSITLLKVGGKKFDKRSFEDYQQTFEDEATSTERIWAEYDRFIFINQNAYAIGDTLDLFGTRRAPKLSTASDLLPFSPNNDDEETGGNWAIVLLAYGEALSSEKKKNPTEGTNQTKKGFALLDVEWQPYGQRKAFEQRSQPMFNVPNFFGSSSRNNIGNF